MRPKGNEECRKPVRGRALLKPHEDLSMSNVNTVECADGYDRAIRELRKP